MIAVLMMIAMWLLLGNYIQKGKMPNPYSYQPYTLFIFTERKAAQKLDARVYFYGQTDLDLWQSSSYTPQSITWTLYWPGVTWQVQRTTLIEPKIMLDAVV